MFLYDCVLFWTTFFKERNQDEVDRKYNHGTSKTHKELKREEKCKNVCVIHTRDNELMLCIQQSWY